MKPSNKIPVPITFNPFKHHKNCILKEIDNQQLPDERLLELLNSIGNNYIDIYTGSFTPTEICKQILIDLKNKEVYLPTIMNYPAASGQGINEGFLFNFAPTK